MPQMNEIFDDALMAKVRDNGVIAVLVIDRVEDAVPLAQALMAGGVSAMELTLRTDAALPALKAIRKEIPEMMAGIGTVLTVDQLKQVADADAAFAVSPGLNPKVLQAALDMGMPFAPGIVTPSDIECALEFGCRLLKFFPAEPSGGLKYLKSMAAPYLHLNLEFVPLGGVNAANAADYLASPLVAAIGGSWIAKRDAIKDGDWDAITANAREAVEIFKSAR